MTSRLLHWYAARSPREQRLLLAMTAIAVPVLIWALMVLPLSRAYDSALEEQLDAVDRHARVLALVEAATTRPGRGSPAQAGDLQLFVIESAARAGITLQAANPSGASAVEIQASGARSPAAVEWLRRLEAAGIVFEELRMAAAPDGTVNLTGRLARQA